VMDGVRSPLLGARRSLSSRSGSLLWWPTKRQRGFAPASGESALAGDFQVQHLLTGLFVECSGERRIT
jgi:hypothetical protein